MGILSRRAFDFNLCGRVPLLGAEGLSSALKRGRFFCYRCLLGALGVSSFDASFRGAA